MRLDALQQGVGAGEDDEREFAMLVAPLLFFGLTRRLVLLSGNPLQEDRQAEDEVADVVAEDPTLRPRSVAGAT